MENINSILNKQLLLTAFKSQLKVHIGLVDKTFRNGFIKEMSADFFMFSDGDRKEEPIFYIEVYDVKPYVEEGK